MAKKREPILENTTSYHLTSETPVRAVILQGIEMLRKNNASDLLDLETQFSNIFIPLCRSPHKTLTEISIPRSLQECRIEDIAQIMTQEQGQKFCHELFALSIPSLTDSARAILTVKQGGKLDPDIKIGFIHRAILKLAARYLSTENIAESVAYTSNLKWIDDDKNEVKRTLKTKF